MSIKPPLVSTIKRRMSIETLKEIFLKSVESVQPHNLINTQVKVNPRHLTIASQTFPLNRACHLVGFGKAVLGMSLALEKSLGAHLQMGIVTIPEGLLAHPPSPSKIKFIEGAKNNIPDESAMQGALQIKTLAEGLTKEDLLLVLISGGGSALLPLPIPPISLPEKQELIKELSRRGADILELNSVRKEISVLKGGGLARLAYPSSVIGLILSDVVGDPVDFIASGPTVPNRDGRDRAMAVIKKYKCYEGLPASILEVLHQAKPRDSSDHYDHCHNFIIGNNRLAAEAAQQHASSLGFQSAIVSTSLTGNVTEISRIYADLARNIHSVICDSACRQSLQEFLEERNFGRSFIEQVLAFDFGRRVCLVGAGEPTVVVTGSGRGGRNQQLALEFSLRVNKLALKSADISFLSGGTDGMDGPTDAAGAVGTGELVHNCVESAREYLEDNDSYGFFSQCNNGENLIKIGHTGTNVMDIHIMTIEPKEY